MKRLLPLLLGLIATFGVSAESSFTFNTSKGRQVTVTAINDNIIKVTNSLPGDIIQPPHWGEPEITGSFNVLGTPAGVKVLTTPAGVQVKVKPNGTLSISAGEGRELFDSGIRSEKNGKQTIRLKTNDDLHFYGAGERGYSFNLAGDTLVMYNKQNYGYVAGEQRIKQMGISMPLFLASSGFAVVFDDYAAATMTMTNPVIYETESPNPISYYFINGNGTLAQTTRELSYLTGRQPLAPLWSLGYITSKYGYKTQQETLGVVDTLKSIGYPLDGIILDLYWYGKEQDMGRLAWDKDQWPDHKLMLDSLASRGVHLIPISQPYVLRNGRGVDNFNYLAPRNMLVADTSGRPLEVEIWVGKGGMLDVSNPETARWLTHLYKQMAQEGVSGFWGDLGEPEVHPDSALHHNGLTTRLYHNLYGNDWSKIIYDMYQKEFPTQRNITMMRAGTTGLQRYGVFPWSTDVSRSWGGFKPQIPIMLNSSLSGMGFMSSDIGGFAIDDNHPYDPELYVRWFQLGAFSPVLRTHAQRTAEPYNYPEQEDILIKFARERYRWLPYNYSLAFENALNGTPLVRPLNFYSGSSKYDDIANEYLWGRDLLVAPVMEPGVSARSIVFPEGQWVDLENASLVFQEGDTISYPAPLDILPRFARAGSFLVGAPEDIENTSQLTSDHYLVNYYPVQGVSEESVLYEDDRTNPNSISQNQFSKITFYGSDTKDLITIKVTNEGTYPGAPEIKKMTFRIHNVMQPKKVLINGKNPGKQGISYDKKHKVLTLTTPWEVASELEILLKQR